MPHIFIINVSRYCRKIEANYNQINDDDICLLLPILQYLMFILCSVPTHACTVDTGNEINLLKILINTFYAYMTISYLDCTVQETLYTYCKYTEAKSNVPDLGIKLTLA
jgi:hypothetical protein